MSVTHVGTEIGRPAEDVAAFVRHYPNLPLWATGLASGVTLRDGSWFTDSPMGQVRVAFVPENAWGVCDHDVTAPDGTTFTNPMRVIADGPRCQVVFTVRGHDIEADAALVAADLQRLKVLLERP